MRILFVMFDRIPALEKDYLEMSKIYFHEQPAFSLIFEKIVAVEKRINECRYM